MLVISVKPALSPGPSWCLHIGAWHDPDHVTLEGFASGWDAWAFAVAHGIGDPSADHPEFARKQFNRPPAPPPEEDTIHQLSLF